MSKRKKVYQSGIELGDEDVLAITCSLSFVPSYTSGSKEQDSLNTTVALKAIDKLTNRDLTFSMDEVRVISASIEMARMLIKGKQSDILPDITPDEKANLTSHIFTYNRLSSVFSEHLERMMKMAGVK